MLIHKMKANPNWGKPNKNGSIYPSDPWPAMSNPYLPVGNQSVSMSPNTMVVTAEDLKKLVKVKKYRSIDDPWEGA